VTGQVSKPVACCALALAKEYAFLGRVVLVPALFALLSIQRFLRPVQGESVCQARSVSPDLVDTFISPSVVDAACVFLAYQSYKFM
jgi:hypothetical protein